MTAKKNVLGRGLGALIESADTSNREYEGVNEISILQIEVNPFQPRTHFNEEAIEDLSESIKRLGIIQPITVRKISENSYQLISGERRLRACKLAKLATIPAFIRESDDKGMLEMALVENIQREDLDSIEVAISYQRLIDECNLTQEELSERVGKKRATITNYLRLLKLPPEIQLGIRQNQISMGHARALINVSDPETQIMIYEQIIRYDFSVRKVEEIVRNLSLEETPQKKSKQSKKINFTDDKKTISTTLGCRVSIIADDSGKGKISLSFKNNDEYSKLIAKLISKQEI